MAQDRAAALAEIAAQVRPCTKCELHLSRTRAVPGAGNPNSEIMFIGEGPGYHEDQQGLPFVGRSGDYLVSLLKLIGLTRDQVFITNVVKCRPPGNRDPLPDEILTCKPYLDSQVDIIDPLVIVTLGRFSMARYFPGAKITQIHGKPKYENGRAYYPMFHPAAALRAQALMPQMEADIKRLQEVIAKVKDMRAAGAAPAEAPKDEPPPTQLLLF
ncbi:MAG: uracil-DNA glycosylase [Anaerolineae bacterium]|nr:uracil-DNA glycosylase [Anaerolineae bacterium]